MADPFDLDLDSLLGEQSLSIQPRQRKRKKPTISPEEEEAILESLLGAGMSGIQMAANVLDTPGSFARGLLAGEPGRAFAGILDPDQRVSGRELGQEYGLLGRNQAGLDWGDVGAFGIEAATDPLTYLTFGASTALGTSAKAAGTAAKGFLPSIKAGERSLVSASIPFANIAADFTGPGAASVGQAIGTAVRKPIDAADELLGMAGFDEPISRGLDYGRRLGRAMFDPAAGGKIGPEEQELAGLIHDRRYATEQAYTGAAREAAQAIDTAFDGTGIDRGDFDRLVRTSTELDPMRAMTKVMPGNPAALQAGGRADQAAQTLKTQRDDAYERLRSLGGSGELLGEDQNALLGHFPRGVDPERLADPKAAKRIGGRGFGIPNQRARDEELRNVATDVLNDIAMDKSARGKNAADHILATYGPYLDQSFGQKIDQATGAVAAPGSSANHAKALAKWVKDKPAERWFNRGALEDQTRYLRGVETAASNVEAAQEFLAKYAGDDPSGVPLSRLYGAIPGFDKTRAVEHIAGAKGVDPKAAAALTVPPEVAEAVANALKPLNKADGWGKEILKAIDGFTNISKKALTIPWPKFHTRNFVGAQYLNLATGLMRTPADIAEYAKAFADVAAGKIDDATLDEMRSLRVLGGDVTGGLSAESGEDLLRAGLGDRRTPDGIAVSKRPKAPQTRLGKAASRAVAPARAYMRGAEGVARWVDRMAREPLYVYLKRKAAKSGTPFDPVAAAREVAARQFDYADTAGADPVFRRVFPFWNWMKQSSVLTLRTIAERPGGAMAQTVRAGETGRKEAGWLPDWLGETAAIPVPGNPDRYITKLGLPTDDVFGRFAFGATPMKTAQRTFEKAIAQTSPLIGGVYTLASGREPFFGRELQELYPYPTDDPLTNAVIGKSPLSRAVGTVRTLTDDRKGAGAKATNLLAPFGVTDLSGGIERQKQFAITNAIEDLLDEVPHVRRYERYYIPANEQEQVSPEDRQLLDLIDLYRQRSREAAQAR